jgi:hypothetical protein
MQVTFPETAQFQKSYNFTYADNNVVTTSLSLAVETYFPSFDDHSTFYKGNRIDQFNLRQGQAQTGSALSDSWVDIDFPPSE